MSSESEDWEGMDNVREEHVAASPRKCLRQPSTYSTNDVKRKWNSENLDTKRKGNVFHPKLSLS